MRDVDIYTEILRKLADRAAFMGCSHEQKKALKALSKKNDIRLRTLVQYRGRLHYAYFKIAVKRLIIRFMLLLPAKLSLKIVRRLSA